MRIAKRGAPKGASVPHDIRELEFRAGAGIVFICVATRDECGVASDNIVGEYSTVEAIEHCIKFAKACQYAMDSEAAMKRDTNREAEPIT